MNNYLLSIWSRIPDQESFLNRLTKLVAVIWVLAILMGFLTAYRFGEYMQTKRLAHSYVIQVPVYTN